MPVPDQRDPEVTRDHLADVAHRPAPGCQTASSSTRSRRRLTNGFSAETLMFEAQLARAGRDGSRRERLVAKVAPTGFQIFPEPRFAEQFRLLHILADTQLPVPLVYWHEPDPAVLGAPFYVMSRVDGRRPDRHAAVPHRWLGDRGQPGRARDHLVVGRQRLDPGARAGRRGSRAGLRRPGQLRADRAAPAAGVLRALPRLGLRQAPSRSRQAALGWLHKHRPAESSDAGAAVG